jgi:hypothetical protein
MCTFSILLSILSIRLLSFVLPSCHLSTSRSCSLPICPHPSLSWPFSIEFISLPDLSLTSYFLFKALTRTASMCAIYLFIQLLIVFLLSLYPSPSISLSLSLSQVLSPPSPLQSSYSSSSSVLLLLLSPRMYNNFSVLLISPLAHPPTQFSS